MLLDAVVSRALGPELPIRHALGHLVARLVECTVAIIVIGQLTVQYPFPIDVVQVPTRASVAVMRPAVYLWVRIIKRECSCKLELLLLKTGDNAKPRDLSGRTS